MSDNKSNDLIVQPFQYAYISDDTKGNIVCYVGPTKTSLAATDRPVRFVAKTALGVPPRFESCHLTEAVCSFTNIPEGWYGVLKNPAENNRHPAIGTSIQGVELIFGRKVNIPGPSSFALFPGQMAKVHRGHRLRSNQYLVARVYNDEAARQNISQAIAKPATEGDGDPQDALGEEAVSSIFPSGLTMGQLFIIKGTEVSFFIPPTGIEVVSNEKGEYVQDAVTLEQLEYCILLDQSGSKRYARGPAVVFPSATETFVRNGDRRKFRAIELNAQMGLYIKVIADYEDHGVVHRQGDELFVTGKDTQIYFPRPEHALIRQTDTDRTFATAVPKGDGRYVLDKVTGHVELVKGPLMLLPDPRTHVIVRRVLTEKQVSLWFPGNDAAQVHNSYLRNLSDEGGYVSEQEVQSSRSVTRGVAMDRSRATEGPAVCSSAVLLSHDWAGEEAGEAFAGDALARNKGYTRPRMITIDSKFDGAVRIAVRSGYAVNVVSKSGERRTVVGPETILLEYDEELEPFNLSVGRPKGEGGTRFKQDVYLRVHANKVSDVISATTKDLVALKIDISYRVSFSDALRERWFAVENYPKLLCEHLAARVRNKLKHYGLSQVNLDGFDLIRETVLGQTEGDQGARPGSLFSENGMLVYDVEIFDIRIADPAIAGEIDKAQRETVALEIQAVLGDKRLEASRKSHLVDRALLAEETETETLRHRTTVERVESALSAELASIAAGDQTQEAKLEVDRKAALGRSELASVEVERRAAEFDAEHGQRARTQELALAHLDAKTRSFVAQVEAVDPVLSAKLQGLSDTILGSTMIRELGAPALLRGQSMADVLAQLAHGAPGVGALLELLQSPPHVPE